MRGWRVLVLSACSLPLAGLAPAAPFPAGPGLTGPGLTGLASPAPSTAPPFHPIMRAWMHAGAGTGDPQFAQTHRPALQR